MKTIFTTLNLVFAMLLFCSCGKKLLPAAPTVTKDSTSTATEYKYRDTLITTPIKFISIHDTLPCPELTYEKETVDSTGKLKLSVKIKKGILTASCHEDSLLQRIAWLEKYQFTFKNHSEVKQVPYPVEVIKFKTPKWFWLLVAYAVSLTVWTFRKPIIAIVKTVI